MAVSPERGQESFPSSPAYTWLRDWKIALQQWAKLIAHSAHGCCYLSNLWHSFSKHSRMRCHVSQDNSMPFSTLAKMINTMICKKISNLADTEKEEIEIMMWDTWSSWQGSMQWVFTGACVPWELWQVQALGLASPQNWPHVSLGKKPRMMTCAAVGELGKSGETATSGLPAWEIANLKWSQYVKIGSGFICNSVLSQGGLLQAESILSESGKHLNINLPFLSNICARSNIFFPLKISKFGSKSPWKIWRITAQLFSTCKATWSVCPHCSGKQKYKYSK